MKDSKKIPNQDNTNLKENAINKKSNPSDGVEINQQKQDKREKHQPRDNA